MPRRGEFRDLRIHGLTEPGAASVTRQGAGAVPVRPSMRKSSCKGVRTDALTGPDGNGIAAIPGSETARVLPQGGSDAIRRRPLSPSSSTSCVTRKRLGPASPSPSSPRKRLIPAAGTALTVPCTLPRPIAGCWPDSEHSGLKRYRPAAARHWRPSRALAAAGRDMQCT